MNAHTLIALITPSILIVHANAQNFDHTVDSNTSSVSLNSTIQFDSSGTITGDYDPKTNPEGTQTRAGFFGGSGNNPIDTSAGLQAQTDINTNPSGSFQTSIDFENNLIEIDGFTLDLLNGETGGTELSVSLFYDTFRTFSPSFLYPGGIPLDIPFGEISGLSNAMITQTELGLGTITPTETPDLYDFNAIISAEMDIAINTSFPGQDPTDTPIDALPIVIPATGTIEIMNDGSMTIIMSLTPDPIEAEFPIEDATLPAIPFELPTFGSDTAGVIYSATPESISLNASIGLTLTSSGTQSACAADITGDGSLNFFDVSAFLNAYNAQDQIADFTNDGVFNFFDVSAFLNAYNAGCP